MALLLSCQNLAKAFSRPLFTGITLGLYDGERIGLIGPNGSGKSTFIKILAGLETADGGEVTKRRDLNLSYVPQEDHFPADATPTSVLMHELIEHHHLEEHDRLTRTAIQLTQLDFENHDQPVNTLSGGWKKRLAIARALVTDPNLVLMDEPTNHLDLEGIVWLEKLLKQSKFSTLVVSHDRYFLENMTTRIIEINRTYPDGFFSVTGSYTSFLERRQDFLAGQEAEQQSLQNTVRHEIEWLKKGPKARTTKAKFRINDAHRLMDDLADLKSRNTANTASAKMDFAATERKTNKLLAVHNISKSIGEKLLFKDVSLVLSPGMKLGLLGPNGSGKSTLLRILTDQLQPDTGTIKRADALRTVFFDQARAKLDKSMTLREALVSASPGATDQVIYNNIPIHINTWAKRFLFRTEQLNLTINQLSGGEQSRVLVARLMLEPADLLILDEPTNDLDIPSLDVLEDALEEFPGALVLVTHDRFMLDRLSTELLALDGKGGAHIYADLQQWQNAQNKPKTAAATSAPKSAKAAEPQKKKLTYGEQIEMTKMEPKILAAEQEVERLQKQMETLLADPKKLQACCDQLAVAQTLVHTLYERWSELEAKKG